MQESILCTIAIDFSMTIVNSELTLSHMDNVLRPDERIMSINLSKVFLLMALMISYGHSSGIRKYHIKSVPVESLIGWSFDAQADTRLACELSAFKSKKLAFSFANKTCRFGSVDLNNGADKTDKDEQVIVMRGML